MKLLLMTVLLALTNICQAEPSAEFGDLAEMRVFNQMSSKQLRALFTDADGVGVRRVRDMKAIFKAYARATNGSDAGDPRIVAIHVPTYFKLEPSSEWEFPNRMMTVEKFEVHFMKTEADDSSWPAATFLKLGRTWVLLPAFACGGPCGSPFVAKGDDENEVVFVRADHSFSGERGQVVGTSLIIQLSDSGAPSISEIATFEKTQLRKR